MLLVVGLSAGFGVLWLLLFNGQKTLAYYLSSQPVLSVSPGQVSEQPRAEEIVLPFPVPGTCLVAEQIVLYEGPFLEPGSTEETIQTAALLLRNTGEFGVESARVIFEAGAVKLVFEADTIPAGQAVLVMEKDGREYGPQKFTGCTGWAVCGFGSWSREELLEIKSVGMGAVVITNQTDRVLTDIQLYYKSYLPEPGFYVGGHTFICLIERLEASQTICIYPSHYANGYSGFVKVEVTGIQ